MKYYFLFSFIMSFRLVSMVAADCMIKRFDMVVSKSALQKEIDSIEKDEHFLKVMRQLTNMAIYTLERIQYDIFNDVESVSELIRIETKQTQPIATDANIANNFKQSELESIIYSMQTPDSGEIDSPSDLAVDIRENNRTTLLYNFIDSLRVLNDDTDNVNQIEEADTAMKMIAGYLAIDLSNISAINAIEKIKEQESDDAQKELLYCISNELLNTIAILNYSSGKALRRSAWSYKFYEALDQVGFAGFENLQLCNSLTIISDDKATKTNEISVSRVSQCHQHLEEKNILYHNKKRMRDEADSGHNKKSKLYCHETLEEDI